MFDRTCPRLIEVALPVREISAESVRDKSLRHGHISTLHLWWARRPLAASRAVVFASLVPDPDDPRCPHEFRAAVERYLKTHVPPELKYYRRGRELRRDEDPYRPYLPAEGSAQTGDGMPDTLRNRLLMFIAKWSPESLAFEAGKAKKEPDPKYLLDDRSLVKWETSDPENPQGREILRIARELVKVAYGGLPAPRPGLFFVYAIECEDGSHYIGHTDDLQRRWQEHLDGRAADWTRKHKPVKIAHYEEFTSRENAVKRESDLKTGFGRKWLKDLIASGRARQAGEVPTVLDPFAGGGAIPLEAGRLGCQAIANDYNPVAYLILRATCEFPQKYGRPGKRRVIVDLPAAPDLFTAQAGEFGKQVEREIGVPNVLAHDVERWARWILDRARERIGHLYPPGKDLPAPRRGKCYIYVLKCSDDSFYIGQTEDIPRRLSEHRSGKVSWTSRHLPVEIIHWEEFDSREAAVKREHDLKTGFGRTWLKREFEAGRLAARQAGGRPAVGYLWARTVPCSNPSCRGEIPLLRSLLVSNKRDKKVALTMEVDKTRKAVRFGIAKGKAIQRTEGTKRERGPAICPFCEQPTSEAELRRAGQAGQMGERMVAVIVEDKEGKDYRPVEETDLAAFRAAEAIEVERPVEPILPEITAADAEDVANSTGIRVHLYGMKTWGSLFNPRQLVAMQTFVACLRQALERMREEIPDEDYRKVVGIYLGLWLSRNSMRMSNVGRWDVGGEKFQTPFDGAKLPMKWDYPEANPFSDVTGGFLNQLDWVTAFIARESPQGATAGRSLRGDGAALALADGSVDATVTDPPYFDEAAYADLSDFFYVWLKRAIGDLVPEAMATPLTPKADEATALKHRHGGDGAAADKHFTDKLAQVFAEAKRLTKENGVYSIVFAHQETQAWTALIRSLFAAGLTIDATWPIEMEMKNRMRGLNSAALETSITVICRPRVVGSAASFKQVRKEIEQVVRESVKRFWSYGFRGADLIVACYGPAVGVFGKYERVEKADGTPVGIPELLELAKQAARDAIAGEFRGDNLSTLYYVWANLYGTSEQSWDDARLVVQIGLPAAPPARAERSEAGGGAAQAGGSEENAMEVARGHGLFVVDGATCRLALLADRAGRRGLGTDPNPPLIDALHRSLLLWKQEKRRDLLTYLAERGLLEDGPYWKLAQALFEVLPRDLEDWKLVSALLSERPTLRAEAKQAGYRDRQAMLFEERWAYGSPSQKDGRS